MKSTATVELTAARELRVDRSSGMNQPRSLDDWSNWFRRSEPPTLATRVVQNPEFSDEMASKWVAPMIPKPRRVAISVAKKSVRPAAVSPRRRPSRRVVDTLRSTCQRLRTFDDWSNWFWKGGSSEDLALA